MSGPNTQELKQQLSATDEQLTKVVADILALITSDAPRFISNQVRDRFFDAVDFSETLSDETLQEIISKVRTKAAAATTSLRAQLSDVKIWIISPPKEDPQKYLEANSAVWTALQKIPDAACSLLSEYGFPEDGEDGYRIEYRTPAYFINGRYLPAMIEKYWTILRNRVELQKEVHGLEIESRKELLKTRWSNAIT